MTHTRGTRPMQARSGFDMLVAAGRKPIGAYVMSTDSSMTAIYGAVGFDFVIVDMEHGRNTLSDIVSHMHAALAKGLIPFVRTLDDNPAVIQHCLDMEAQGIVVPKIGTAEQAERVVTASRYARGGRGKCPIVPATGFSRADWAGHAGAANENVVVMPLIETIEGVENIAAITAVDGVDHVFFGHADLGQEVGYTAEEDPARFRRLWEQVVAGAHQNGARVGAASESSFAGEADFLTTTSDVASVRLVAERELRRVR